jgi:disulfide bond formation protein DsbB
MLQAPPIAAVILAAVGRAATIFGPWFVQSVPGCQPCRLCAGERYPYYFGIRPALLFVLGDRRGTTHSLGGRDV